MLNHYFKLSIKWEQGGHPNKALNSGRKEKALTLYNHFPKDLRQCVTFTISPSLRKDDSSLLKFGKHVEPTIDKKVISVSLCGKSPTVFPLWESVAKWNNEMSFSWILKKQGIKEVVVPGSCDYYFWSLLLSVFCFCLKNKNCFLHHFFLCSCQYTDLPWIFINSPFYQPLTKPGLHLPFSILLWKMHIEYT